MKKSIKSAARRTRSILGVSVPAIETGAATAGGILAANWLTGQIITSVNRPELQTWWGKASVKLGVGVALRMLIGRVSRKWGNAALGGAIASAVLTVVKQWSGPRWDTGFGLTGLIDDTDLSGLTTYTDFSPQLYGEEDLAGVFNSNDIYAAAN